LEGLIEGFFTQVEAAAEAWRGVAQSVRDQVFGLLTGNLGPTNPSARFAIAQGEFASAQAAFFANPTAEGATHLQGLAQTLLEIASEFMTRPSGRYQGLLAEVTGVLEQVATVAEGMAPAVDPAQQLVDLFAADLLPLQDAIAGTIGALLTQQTAAQDALTQLAGDLGADGYLAQLQAQQLEALRALHADLAAVAAHFGVAITPLPATGPFDPPFPGATVPGSPGAGTLGPGTAYDPIPGYGAGTPYVPRTGLALVHQGERIISAEANARGGGGGLVINVPVTVHGSGDPEAIRRAVKAAVVESLRFGQGRAVVQDVIRDTHR
jgi:hypothetical protein